MTHLRLGPVTAKTVAKMAALVALIALGFIVSVRWLRPEPPSVPVEANDKPHPNAYKFTGAGSCSSVNCHGGVSPRPNERVKLNEYSIWVVEDKHAKAYQVLFNEQSRRMAKILKLDKPETSAKCLGCHATNVPRDWQTKSFDISDGVSCESCHGPAEQWLGPHTRKDWSHEQSVKMGMYDTKDLVLRAEKCLTCHLGTAEQWVDHEMIAAGHPELKFELDTYTAVMPPHWQEKDEDPWLGPRAWALGQAVALREGLKQLARRAESTAWNQAWPEFAEFDCYACHHSLRQPSWRQVRGYKGTPGHPTWNDSRYVVFRHFVAQISPEIRQTLDQHIERLHHLLGQASSRRQEIAEAATATASMVNRLASDIANLKFDEQRTRALLRAISGDAQVAKFSGVAAAEQVAMSIQTLYATYAKVVTLPNHNEIKAAINRLYDDLQDPARFDPTQFAAHLQAVHRLFQ